jgi:hypothetical protein
MTPFLHFRSWLRSGPAGERLLTAVAGTAVLALVVWASTPFGGKDSTLSSDTPSSGSTSPGATTAPAVGGGTTGGSAGTSTAGGTTGTGTGGGGSGAVVPGTSGGTTGTGTGATTGTTGTGGTGAGTPVAPGTSCGAPGATDQGVTSTTITAGVVIVDLGAASNLIAVPSAADQRKAWNAATAALNAKGGVLCRKLVLKFYTDSVLDVNQEHRECLQMAADKVFVVFNNLFNTTELTCIAKQKIPNVWYTPPHTPDVKQYSPYILSWQPDFDQLIRAYVRGAKAEGWFNGMKKLGILTQDCYPDEFPALKKELTAVGIDPGKASVFNYGCSQLPQNNQADQSAVLQFKREGVTHILNVHDNNDANFSTAADQQNYYPRFAHMEDASATAIETGSTKPGKSFDKTLLITTIQTGAAHTPGYRFNKPTQECTQLLAKAGLPSAYSAGVASLFGIACIDTALFKAMAEKAPSLKRTQLATGLARVGPIDLAYPGGPINITNAKIPTGGQLARPGVWVSSCNCWKLTDVRFRAY